MHLRFRKAGTFPSGQAIFSVQDNRDEVLRADFQQTWDEEYAEQDEYDMLESTTEDMDLAGASLPDDDEFEVISLDDGEEGGDIRCFLKRRNAAGLRDILEYCDEGYAFALEEAWGGGMDTQGPSGVAWWSFIYTGEGGGRYIQPEQPGDSYSWERLSTRWDPYSHNFFGWGVITVNTDTFTRFCRRVLFDGSIPALGRLGRCFIFRIYLESDRLGPREEGAKYVEIYARKETKLKDVFRVLCREKLRTNFTLTQFFRHGEVGRGNTYDWEEAVEGIKLGEVQWFPDDNGVVWLLPKPYQIARDA